MDTAQTTEKKDAELGLSLNKKTMLAITLVLVAILVFVGVLTQVLQRGEFDLTEIDGHEAIVNGTYHELAYKMPVWKIVLSPILCFTSSQASTGIAIILIIFFIGGSFLILDKVGVLQYIMASLIRRFQNRKYLLMAIVIFVSLLLSSTAGILEESLTLVPIAVAVSLALGWDSLVGLGISLVAIAALAASFGVRCRLCRFVLISLSLCKKDRKTPGKVARL